MDTEATARKAGTTSSGDFLYGGSEMAELIRSCDWSRTPLGQVEDWSQSLRTTIRIMLAQRFPMLLWWGPEYVQFYNDAYVPIPGAKHPHSLGQRASECWSEIWHILRPLVDTPFQGGPATWMEDLPLELNRHGFLEETHFTIAYSPVPDETAPRGIGGVLATVHEITEKVLSERRVEALRDCGAGTLNARTPDEACKLAAESLAKHPKDIPFLLLYLAEKDGVRLRLAGAAGVEPGDPAAPEAIDATDGTGWPVAAALRSGEPAEVPGLAARFGRLPAGVWADPPRAAMVLPIRGGAQQPAGAAVFGISPRLAFDGRYLSFFELAASQIAAAVASAGTYEEERKRAEALAEIDRAKTAFFSNVSHEFRTPLTLILGPVSEMISRPAAVPDPETLASLHRNALRLEKLVNTLLEFSRIEAGRVQAAYEPVDLAAATTELASGFRSATAKAGLYLRVDCPPLPEPVYVDREMWEKIVLNLLSNAFKFTFEGGIDVSLRPSRGGAELRIADTGTGIAAAELPRIFERFYRIEGSRGRTFEGTGIGLSLVSELVKLHGGETRAESEPGKGSAFSVWLPFGSSHLPQERLTARTEPPPAAATAIYVEEAHRWIPQDGQPAEGSAAARAAAGRASVLVVDDNADMRDYLGRILGERFRVRTAPHGEAALQVLEESVPDLVLSDVMMPGMDGFELLRRIRSLEHARTIPVILVSARADEAARVEGLGAGADDYLIKPFSERELLARVSASLQLAEVRRAASEAVRASENRLRRLFESNLFGVAFGEWDGMVREANDAFLNSIGYSRDDLAQGEIRFHRITAPEFRDADLHAFQELRRAVSCKPYEKEFVRKDGTRVPVLGGAALIEPPVESQAGCVVYCLDLTERKKLDAQMRQTQKLESLGVLAGGVAHDFNNLLVGILGNASLALESTPSSNPNRALLQEAVKASERAADLTKQLLAYAGKGRFVVDLIDISALIREIATLLQVSIPKNVEIRLDLQEGLPFLEGDASQIQQLVMNLIINGAEAMGEANGTVFVFTGVQQVDEYYLLTAMAQDEMAPGRYVYVEVQDTGCGMDEATRNKIFDPFFTTKFMGRGLGLAAAQGIMRGHRGAIRVYSKPGKGSTFKALFPVRESPAQRAESPPEPSDLTDTGLVLVVDDEEIVRRTVKSALQRYGYSVLLAENGQEAVDVFKTVYDRVAAVVLDMTMPVMGGEETLRHLQTIDPGVKVILSSGFNEVEAIRRFTGKGLAGFLQKPYTARALAAKIKETRTKPGAL